MDDKNPHQQMLWYQKENQNLICLDEYEEPAACDEYNLELKEALAALDEKYRIIMILFTARAIVSEKFLTF